MRKLSRPVSANPLGSGSVRPVNEGPQPPRGCSVLLNPDDGWRAERRLETAAFQLHLSR